MQGSPVRRPISGMPRPGFGILANSVRACYALKIVNRPKEQKNLQQLRFLTSAVDLDGCPSDSFPEIAIIGRSNAGKSTLINGIAQSRIAQVSGTPGKTRLLNFYQAPRYRLVDMPG